jgi:hypothetical protein
LSNIAPALNQSLLLETTSLKPSQTISNNHCTSQTWLSE